MYADALAPLEEYQTQQNRLCSIAPAVIKHMDTGRPNTEEEVVRSPDVS